ncbi:hypothetical protein GIB67_007423, partial [Kingdonia uniflora]
PAPITSTSSSQLPLHSPSSPQKLSQKPKLDLKILESVICYGLYVCFNLDLSSDHLRCCCCRGAKLRSPIVPHHKKIAKDCGFWCWVDEYLLCPCGYGPCKLCFATSSKKRFYCCPHSKSKQERGCGFLKWFDEVNDESSTFTPATTTTPTFATSTTIKDLEIKYKIELVVAQAKIEMLQSITEDLAKINLKK